MITEISAVQRAVAEADIPIEPGCTRQCRNGRERKQREFKTEAAHGEYPFGLSISNFEMNVTTTTQPGAVSLPPP
jgi:hypothetical protein